MMSSFPHRNLLGINQLQAGEILYLLDEAEQWLAFNRQPRKRDERLAGLTIINIFFENSTRTLLSFEIAGKRLGAQVVNMRTAQSSLNKGESLVDTALTLGAMRPDVLVIRHATAGVPQEIAGLVGCSVINAGDGTGEHPTQALLDALTIRRRKGRIDGLKIAICGDIRHSRVARSNLLCLPRLGAEVRVVGPDSLLPDELGGIASFTDMDEGIEGADIVMMLRIQRERMPDIAPESLGDFYRLYGLSRERLARAAPDAIVMHPGPINRGVEIDGEIADDPDRSAILDQVEAGVATRMACLDLLTRASRDLAP
ncbi:aspartate carbamoyltransferase catalytic subunit [Sphingosinicella rhizophila]|uniref:Aspartate carbamoyltransferase n=1 Tax=Sphingosinicella rhizophila TaxID=3050082 RepID=A0ABU3Q316_9SPHN|nr:aspartate carbamoyltransferase catalytic subunit [Sphingosinicella sp. GR2756]MDT9597801.1 aspartate carbamoyltransferase catalytic subunit [Sphingosinicella sp. GR2756]